MTKEEILDKNGFDFKSFSFDNEHSAKNLLLAMDEYVYEKQRELRNIIVDMQKDFVREIQAISLVKLNP